ncbi:hypothetical protein ACFYUY_22955 [Kitasatospora sp. NPDC004745]|uniref:hypothetical protein n=1 Tax=Kitasatospora sp. NPDC004745 TaxID=3364019 RepID=UPI0036A1EF17
MPDRQQQRLPADSRGPTPPDGAPPPSGPPTGEFEAVHEPDHYTVSLMVGSKPGQGVGVMVTLPCQAPPAGAATPTPTVTT